MIKTLKVVFGKFEKDLIIGLVIQCVVKQMSKETQAPQIFFFTLLLMLGNYMNILALLP